MYLLRVVGNAPALLQVDMFSPKNFGLEPTAVSNDRMCLLHRAMCGSLERFFGLVLEHLDGHLPSWLAPVQVWY